MAGRFGLPERDGLYDPRNEHDACGVGFIAHLEDKPSHIVVKNAIQLLCNLAHRGATGADPDTGDGAGIMIQVPDRFLRAETDALGFTLPAPGTYGVGNLFLSPNEAAYTWQKFVVNEAIAAAGLTLLGWRKVPTDPSKIGWLARKRVPVVEQVFVTNGPDAAPTAASSLEQKLYFVRRSIENRIEKSGGTAADRFYVTGLSTQTLIYKGLLLASQIDAFYPDLADERIESAIALVHQRYSTNTFPAWELAQPFRFLAHNGEINTLRGNRSWMQARVGTLQSKVYGERLREIFPVLQDGSDSCQLDNALEFLVAHERSLSHAICMLMPEAWERHDTMDEDKRAFYEYHSYVMEPWDGPASVAFTNGTQIGAVLDRNGLRPSRYVVTKNGHVIMGSEVGCIQVPPEEVQSKGRIQPGKIFLVDLEEGRIISDEEVKRDLVARKPYRAWLEKKVIDLADVPEESATKTIDDNRRRELQQAFGYTREDLQIVLAPMIGAGKEAIGSMGDDAALACLSDRPRLLYNYFKQTFAQVTNPAIDSIRERLVMSLRSSIGNQRNLLDETPEHVRMIRVRHPLIKNAQLEKLRSLNDAFFKGTTIPILFEAGGGGQALDHALNNICEQASAAVDEGFNIIVLSDRDVNAEMAPIPALLAVAMLHHHLVRTEQRTRCSIVVETGEAREIAHFALLIGYGATSINPYLVYETLKEMVEDGAYLPDDITYRQARTNYFAATTKGLLKIFAKMGISTIKSYRGAQMFEAVGLSRDFVDVYFSDTPSRIGGVDVHTIAIEAEMRHGRAFPPQDAPVDPELDPGGLYQWRRRGEKHAFRPEMIAKLQKAVRTNDYAAFKRYAQLADDYAENLCTLRGLFRFRYAEQPVALDDVEPAAAIARRFCTGAMSFGSISKEAHETLAIAMNRIGGKSNSGEGGEDPARFTPDENGDSRRSAIKQIASGRFGVTSHYLVNADELQIKISQGAKPGEGGQLPGHKVSAEIARIRNSTMGVGLISPPPHHDIYSIEDLAQLIFDLKNSNPKARVSVKLVAESGVGTVAAGVAKGKADGVVISGFDGGTGAAPQTSLKNAGIPWEIGLAETQQTLVKNDLRGRIRVQVDGGLRTGRDVVVGALLGAEEFGFSTAPLAAIGCIMMRVCHLNTCPVGIATQDPELRKRFAGKPEQVVNFFMFVAEQVREIMARLGFRKFEDMIGHVELLEVNRALEHWKAKRLDFSDVLKRADVSHALYNTSKQEDILEGALDYKLIEMCRPALEDGKKVELELPIRNVNRTVGGMLGAQISERFGADGLAPDTITIHFTGSTGQSFGAFLPRGVTLRVDGDANDYIGKGLSGGRIIVRTPEKATYKAEDNVIIGNVALYGATSGEAFFNGLAGQRFCVRNSGAIAVVEGVGDHGCEYMTGGRVLILGPTGRNFAAGMSGGIAYVHDPDGTFKQRCNPGMVDIEKLELDDADWVYALIQKHVDETSSQRGEKFLKNWRTARREFVKVMPQDYRRALKERIEAESGDED